MSTIALKTEPKTFHITTPPIKSLDAPQESLLLKCLELIEALTLENTRLKGRVAVLESAVERLEDSQRKSQKAFDAKLEELTATLASLTTTVRILTNRVTTLSSQS